MVKSKAKMWCLRKVGTRSHFSLSSALHQSQPRSFSYVADGERFDSCIHPTAVVHPNAVIGQGVSIGPFCSVSSSAKLGNGCQLHPGSHVFGSTELGDNCMLMTGAVVGDDYPGCTVIGSNNTIGYHAVIGVKCQDMKYKPEDECYLEVGHNNDIREHTSIHRSSKSTDRTVIGNANFIMGSCHIAHDCKIGNNNIFANNTLLAGHVEVEDYVHTAGATVVHQFCHLGSFSFLGGGSVVGLSFYLHGLESICLITREMIVMQLWKHATVKIIGSQHSAEVF
ncbi:putative acyl-[acyl-carrier-protein]--UDP-N-acetylglucosamine O-acyltransferase, mitochondrial isoform C [Glycine soja]|uniref:Putative acyl-[acyl-carrier-protein]--UDP-N-acetylglucosamine O-acyltransferase, mitochondrial isoform B n=1 Tax=Glycine soja TaxID=3848 RepID=A0A445JW86_GLYSO|nr:putative acyl-[acyl-carrier-protein]--UDP-N-acetylglucosamine O-acyltransferase, mitochondrial isoform B [Glycine soja]RZC02709.1 putative acyl-[acyl-carrier-protein]--UDP-N-acetylglucosamine O-acyltransferase, mitochondrial isoform C [Glycine soja]